MGVIAIIIAGCNPLDKAQNKHSFALIDLDVIAKELGRDEVFKQQVTSAEQQLQTQLIAIRDELQGKVNREEGALHENSSNLDKQRVQQLTLQAQQALREKQLEAQQKSNQLKAELISKFREEVKIFAQPIAQTLGFKMVKVISADVLWFDTSLDITDEVIAKMLAQPDQVKM